MNGPIDLDRRGSSRGWTRSTRLLASLGGLAAICMMLHIAIDVVLRMSLNMPLRGTMEISSYYYMVAIVFLPLAYIDWLREAITADLFFGMFPDWLKIVAVFVTLCGMVIAYGGLTMLSFQDALAFMARHEVAMGSGAVPIWAARFIMVIGLAAATLVNAWQLLLFASGRDRASWLVNEIKIEE